MSHVTIYTRAFCGYCHAAKRLLSRKGIAFEEFDVTVDAGKRQEMRDRATGATTVPQIFIDGQHIGGSDELHALHRAGDLDVMLGIPVTDGA